MPPGSHARGGARVPRPCSCIDKHARLSGERVRGSLAKTWEWWSPQVVPVSPGRSAESFTNDKLQASFRFDREAVGELLGLQGIPDTLRSASGRRFGGEEAFLLLLRRLAGRERNWELVKVFGLLREAGLDLL